MLIPFRVPPGLPPLPYVLRENRGPWGWALAVKLVLRGNPGRYYAGMLHHGDGVRRFDVDESGIAAALRELEDRERRDNRFTKPWGA